MAKQFRNSTARAANPAGLVIRVVVYLMLVLTALVTVLLGDQLWLAFREGLVPVWAPLLAPGLFTAFVTFYTVDRWFLVRHKNYPLSRAFFQVALALVFLTFLLPQQATEMRAARHVPASATDPALLLLGHSDEAVRAAACGMLAGPASPAVYERVTTLAHVDSSPSVRESCAHALERLHAAATAEPGLH